MPQPRTKSFSSLPMRAAPACARTPMRPPRYVAIGGGTGLPTVLQGLAQRLRNLPLFSDGPWDLSDCLSAIVTVTDDGGSSGWMRRELGILPPGDARNCLAALAGHSSPLSRVMQYRFVAGGPLSGHTVGNLVLAALAQMTGDFALAVDQLGSLLGTCGRVFPSTTEDVTLAAEFESGETARGETAIVNRGERIRRLWLDRRVRPLPDALRALVNADAIIVGPGSLYTSLLPNLLVGGLAPTLSGANGVRIYVANLMTQRGETDGYTLEDHLRVIREHAGAGLFDYVLVNTKPLSPFAVQEQFLQGAELIGAPEGEITEDGIRIIRGQFATELPGGDVRHSPEILSAAIVDLVECGREAAFRQESVPSETKVPAGRVAAPDPPQQML
jgi:uncharacterized cofD-like protein